MFSIRHPLAAAGFLLVLATPSFGTELQPKIQVLEPQQLAQDVPLANPFSGLYANLFQNPKTLALELDKTPNAAPWAVTPVEVYGRVSWHSLEAAGEGKYDFSVLAKALSALPRGDRFGFRVMAFNPQQQSDTNVETGADGYPVYSDVPDYLETRAHGCLAHLDELGDVDGFQF